LKLVKKAKCAFLKDAGKYCIDKYKYTCNERKCSKQWFKLLAYELECITEIFAEVS